MLQAGVNHLQHPGCRPAKRSLEECPTDYYIFGSLECATQCCSIWGLVQTSTSSGLLILPASLLIHRLSMCCLSEPLQFREMSRPCEAVSFLTGYLVGYPEKMKRHCVLPDIQTPKRAVIGRTTVTKCCGQKGLHIRLSIQKFYLHDLNYPNLPSFPDPTSQEHDFKATVPFYCLLFTHILMSGPSLLVKLLSGDTPAPHVQNVTDASPSLLTAHLRVSCSPVPDILLSASGCPARTVSVCFPWALSSCQWSSQAGYPPLG